MSFKDKNENSDGDNNNSNNDNLVQPHNIYTSNRSMPSSCTWTIHCVNTNYDLHTHK